MNNPQSHLPYPSGMISPADQAALQQARADIDLCLQCQPLPIGRGNDQCQHLALISGPMLTACHGSGTGLAYVRDGAIIAFHLGYRRPDNAPECDYVQLVEICGAEIRY